jgi:hypothetical protein
MKDPRVVIIYENDLQDYSWRINTLQLLMPFWWRGERWMHQP